MQNVTGLLSVALLFLFGCGGAGPVPESPTVNYPAQVVVDSALGFSFDIRDARFSEIVDQDAGIIILAGGFTWSEGPEWVEGANELLFSDVPENVVYRYNPATVHARGEGVWGVDTFLYPSGYLADPAIEGEPGANGLQLDAEGKLLLMQHGERQVARFRENLQDALARNAPIRPRVGDFDVLTDDYGGRQLNSPNDVAIAEDGTLYFTDPPYGVDKTFGEDAREVDFSGVYRLLPGELQPTLLYDGLARPNGIVLTPDESALIVSNSQGDAMRWIQLTLKPATDTTALEAVPFADFTSRVGPDNLGSADGMYMLESGVLLATGPGGVIVFAADGTELGTIRTGRKNANVTVGGADGRDVFITADDLLLEARLAE